MSWRAWRWFFGRLGTPAPVGPRFQEGELAPDTRESRARMEQIPVEWTKYVSQFPQTPFDVCSYCVYSTALLVSGETTRLDFFTISDDEQKGYPFWSNMHIPSMLPMPQQFMLRRIRTFGFTSDMAQGATRLDIGNRVFWQSPAWLFSIHGHKLRPPLMLDSGQNFRFSVEFQEPPILGRGLSGRPIRARVVQVAFIGQILRPLM